MLGAFHVGSPIRRETKAVKVALSPLAKSIPATWLTEPAHVARLVSAPPAWQPGCCGLAPGRSPHVECNLLASVAAIQRARAWLIERHAAMTTWPLVWPQGLAHSALPTRRPLTPVALPALGGAMYLCWFARYKRQPAPHTRAHGHSSVRSTRLILDSGRCGKSDAVLLDTTQTKFMVSRHGSWAHEHAVSV